MTVLVHIAHGDPETEAEVEALQAVRDAAGDAWLSTHGGNDWTAIHLADRGLTGVLDAIAERRSPWWEVRVLRARPNR